jgi:RsiW-degrading membrane proteinase PrsW (M82 family)
MINLPTSTAYLKQITHSGAVHAPLNHSLPVNTSTIVGRDANCQIVLNDNYHTVSQQHCEIRQYSNPTPGWKIRDLESTNGTYINDQRLQSPLELKHGDRIRLGKTGPEFVFECSALIPIKRPERSFLAHPGSSILAFSEVIPFVTNNVMKKSHLAFGIITVICVVMLFASQHWLYNLILGIYLSLACLYVIYLKCGNQKPWWLLAVSGLITITILKTYLIVPFFIVFRLILPGNTDLMMDQLQQGQAISPLTQFITFFFGAGLMEELLKVIPVLIALYIGKKMRSPLREKIGVWNPSDGILLGAASAVGFTFIETLGQYVPSVAASSGMAAGTLLLIPRILGSICGHTAWSSYLGYAIGLSVLKPKKRWKILGIAYLISATLHALWNSISAFSGNNDWVEILMQCLIGVLSYLFLMSSIGRSNVKQ